MVCRKNLWRKFFIAPWTCPLHSTGCCLVLHERITELIRIAVNLFDQILFRRPQRTCYLTNVSSPVNPFIEFRLGVLSKESVFEDFSSWNLCFKLNDCWQTMSDTNIFISYPRQGGTFRNVDNKRIIPKCPPSLRRHPVRSQRRVSLSRWQ